MNYVKKIFIPFIIYTTFTFSQNCGKIDYTFKTDIDAEYIENYTLIFNNNESLCLEQKINQTNSSINEVNTDNGSETNYYAERKNLTQQFFYNDKKTFYFKDIFQDMSLLVKEKYFNWNWALVSGTKKIGNFNCNKATIKFRGRNYTAWYTLEIPVPFGPWKFKGLPGLILEIYDTNKEFHIYSNKVEINKNNCDINFDKKQLNKAISLTSYLQKKDSLIDKLFERISAKRPKGTKPLKRDKNCEDCGKGLEIFDQ